MTKVTYTRYNCSISRSESMHSIVRYAAVPRFIDLERQLNGLDL